MRESGCPNTLTDGAMHRLRHDNIYERQPSHVMTNVRNSYREWLLCQLFLYGWERCGKKIDSVFPNTAVPPDCSILYLIRPVICMTGTLCTQRASLSYRGNIKQIVPSLLTESSCQQEAQNN